MRFVKIFFNALKSLTLQKLMSVFSVGISHPPFAFLFVYSGIKAFGKAMELYPDSSTGNGRGNAFRHAYWTCLVMMYFCKISSPEKSLKWCRKLTDMYEDLFPNKPLETKMDLHNNKVGMNCFMSLLPEVHRQFFESSFFIERLMEKTKEAVLIQSPDEEPDENTLIFLT